MDNIIIGTYVPGQSIIHKMDPRAKLMMVFFYVFIVFLANSYLSYTVLAIFTVLIVLMTRIQLSFIYKGLKPLLWIILFTFLLHIFMTKEGDLLIKLAWFEIYEEGLNQGIFLSLRFLLLIVMTSLLTLTTTPIEVTDGMESLLAPFKKLNFPVHELALMMSISLRFIPTLIQETEKIIKAQTARGTDFTSGPIKDRLKAIVPLLIPLFISAFKRADELATAMEARGYRGGVGRTKFRNLKWGSFDSIMIVLLFLLSVGLFLLRT